MAETINMRRQGAKLVPCAAVDEEALEAFPEGRDLSITIKRARSYRQHKFFFALLQKICENNDDYKTPEQLLVYLKVRLGYVEELKFHNDTVWWTTKSISFGTMGQDEFQKFFNGSLDVIVTEIIPGLDRDDIIREVEDMVGFTMDDLKRGKEDEAGK
jgi:hypothetical protein